MKTNAATKPASEVQQLRLTRIKNWYFPVDLETYKLMKSIGVPLLRVHHDFLPTLRLVTQPKGIKGVEVDFQKEIFDPFLESLVKTWNKKYGTCVIDSHSMSFLSKEPEKIRAAEAAFSKLENLLYDFFSRWGFAHTVQASKSSSGKRLKIQVDYKFDANRMPIMNLETTVNAPPKIQLKLGLMRLTFTFDNPKGKIVLGKAPPGVENPPKHIEPGFVHTLIEISQGGRWTPYHSSKCTVTQLSNVLPLVNALMDVRNQDPHNEDNSPE